MNQPNTTHALLRDTENYLSALHGSVARHDNLAANFGCAGCELRDKLANALRDTDPAAVPVAVSPPATPTDRVAAAAAAMREHWLSTNREEADADGNLPCRCGDWREPGAEADEENDWDAHLAEMALAAVLPGTDPAITRADALNTAAQHLYTALFPAVYDDLGQKAAEGVNRAVSELRRLATPCLLPGCAVRLARHNITSRRPKPTRPLSPGRSKPHAATPGPAGPPHATPETKPARTTTESSHGAAVGSPSDSSAPTSRTRSRPSTSPLSCPSPTRSRPRDRPRPAPGPR
ncbi:hypothetical protein [Streptomyces sp. NPDC005385]|uniref:hypothetical protein n=1 Tax=Streptomyces sp. NPDC005385 TaxID=3157039 RepID=UPI0033A3FA57